MISPCLPTAHSMNTRPGVPPLSSSLFAAAALSTGLVLLQAGDRVMHDLAALDGARTNLDRADPARLGQPVASTRFPHASCACAAFVYGVDLMMRSGGPPNSAAKFQTARPATYRRAACPSDRPSARRRRPSATIGVDLCVAQRPIVLELLDADGLVDVPRRHLPRGDACLDRRAHGRASS